MSNLETGVFDLGRDSGCPAKLTCQHCCRADWWATWFDWVLAATAWSCLLASSDLSLLRSRAWYMWTPSLSTQGVGRAFFGKLWCAKLFLFTAQPVECVLWVLGYLVGIGRGSRIQTETFLDYRHDQPPTLVTVHQINTIGGYPVTLSQRAIYMYISVQVVVQQGIYRAMLVEQFAQKVVVYYTCNIVAMYVGMGQQ